MVEQWLSDPTKVGATVLLMVAIVAYHRGWIVARWSYDSLERQLSSELTRSVEQCKSERDRNERLLSELERVAGASNVLAEKVKQRRT